MALLLKNGNPLKKLIYHAREILFDNSDTSLEATDVQSALVEVASDVADISNHQNIGNSTWYNTTQNLSTTKPITDFKFLFFTYQSSSSSIASLFVPTPLFKASGIKYFANYSENTSDSKYQFSVNYVSDNTITITVPNTDTSYKVYVYGIK